MSPTPPFAFVEADPCRSLIDRADHLRGDPAALSALWPTARVIVLDDDGLALADTDGVLFAPIVRDLDADCRDAACFLGLDASGNGWFSLDATHLGHGTLSGPDRVDLRRAAAQWPAEHAAIYAQARGLQHWRRRHRYCGACGGAVLPSRAGWMGRCDSCDLDHYPRTDPAVIVAVTDGRRLLLGRQASWPARRYSVVAGFVEPGESLEQAVVREVHEETRVRVRSCHYLASQPWPFPGQLMLGFLAQADADVPQVDDELEDARWFDIDEVRAAHARDDGEADDGAGPLLSSSISISRWLVMQWLQHMDDADRETGGRAPGR